MPKDDGRSIPLKLELGTDVFFRAIREIKSSQEGLTGERIPRLARYIDANWKILITALLERLTQVQSEGTKLRSNNAMLQTCLSLSPFCYILHRNIDISSRQSDIDNLTRNKSVLPSLVIFLF
jgi:hypothetical protein